MPHDDVDHANSSIGNAALVEAFRDLSTPLLADGCLRVGVPLALAPPGLRAAVPGRKLAGRAAPAIHFGSVDVFLEAFETAGPGDVLVIDNGGRPDEACIGDLVALEALAAGLAGIVVWGVHRDSADLAAIGLPVFSYGTFPAGPRRLDPRDATALTSARFGDVVVGRDTAVFADEDGALFLPLASTEAVIASAVGIRERERRQAAAVPRGMTLRAQFRFAEYLRARAADPTLTLRQHLERVGGAIEV